MTTRSRSIYKKYFRSKFSVDRMEPRILLTTTNPFVAGELQNAIKLDPTASISADVDMGDPTDNHLDIGILATIEAWVRFDHLPAGGTMAAIMSKDEGTGNVNKWIFGYANNVNGVTGTVFSFNTPAGGTVTLASDAWTPVLGVWNHVAVVKAGTDYTFYLNGVANTSVAQSTGQVVPDVNMTFRLGQAEGSSWLKGSLDDVRLWRVARTDQQISDSMSIELPTPQNQVGLNGYWPMNESSGTQTGDLSPFNTTGIINGITGLDVPALNSHPGGQGTIFLDFDGDTVSNWGNLLTPGTIPAYDTDGITSNFNGQEFANITEIWSRVAEMFSPFNINVTTIDPGSFPQGVSVKVDIGGNGSWTDQTEGGAAILNGFSSPSAPDHVAFVFSSILPVGPQGAANGTAGDPNLVADTIAHEVGHTLGLQNQSVYDVDGNKLFEYNDNNQNSLTAPIMGFPYNAARALWAQGTASDSAADIQDDLGILTGLNNGFGYRADDYGNVAGVATGLGVLVNGTSFTTTGVIEQNTDVDYFSFQALAGPAVFTVSPAQFGAMLDTKFELRDASNVLIASGDTTNLGSTISTTFTDLVGTYYLVVKSNGGYGDIGQYTLTGGLTPNWTPGGPYVVNEGASIPLSAEVPVGSTSTLEWDLHYDGTPSDFHVDFTGNATDQPIFSAVGLDGPGTATVGLRARDSFGTVTVPNSTTINIVNFPPTATFNFPSQVNPGASNTVISLTSPFDPSPADVVAGFTYSYDFNGDGVFEITNSPSNSAIVPSIYLLNLGALDTVKAVISDKDGGQTLYSGQISVTPGAATGNFSGPASVTEGSTALVKFTNISGFGPLHFSFDFNNDGTFDLVNSSLSYATVPASYLSDGPGTRTIAGRIINGGGSITDFTTTITVTNLPPTATFSNVNAVEGVSTPISLTDATDPSTVDVAAGLLYSYDFDNNGTWDVTDSTTAIHNYTFPDNGTFTMRARIKDKDGASTIYTAQATVVNAPPTAVFSNQTVEAGSPVTVNLTNISDATADLTAGLKYSFDFNNDGIYDVVDSSSPSAVVPAYLVATAPATRVIRARVKDKDGGISTYSATLTVVPAIALPEITLLLGDQSIHNNSVTPVNLGVAPQNSAAPIVTLIVRNDGNSPLYLANFTISSGFLLGQAPTAVSPGASASLQIQLDTTTLGTKTGHLSFNTNDADNGDGVEDPFVVSLTGQVITGTGPIGAAGPEITTLLNSVSLPSDGSFSADLGTVSQGQPGQLVDFTIRNDGNSSLILSNFLISPGFIIIHSPAAFIAPGGSDFLEVKLDSSAIGSKQGTVRFTNNDADNGDGVENPFIIGLSGQVTALPDSGYQQGTTQRFVAHLYQDVLHRDAEDAGLQYWVQQLATGVSRTTVAASFFNSVENHTNEIIKFYNNILGRAPDQAGLDSWLAYYTAGGTSEQLSEGFYGSQEYFNNHGGSNTSLLQSYYQAILNRAPDTSGVTFWVNQIVGGASHQDVAVAFVQSLEARRFIASTLYEFYLRRAGDEAGIEFWADQMGQGVTQAQVAIGFLASTEYFQL